MKRLRHSSVGYLRFMQLSSTELFVFVEGEQSDPYFYACILASIPNLNVSYRIFLARELPGAAGGKQALLNFFSFLRRKKMLFSSLSGRNTTCVFFLDKDVDDLQHKLKRSQHVVYTEHYDVQNYIFMHGNLVIGAASAASCDPTSLSGELSDASAWCLRIVFLWREWISLCLLTLKNRIPCEANYRVMSRVQSRPCGCLDSRRYAREIHRVAKQGGLKIAAFSPQVTATTRIVDRYFAKGQHHRLFKGKWFGTILADDIDRIMAGRPYHSNGLARRLPSAIAATIDFTEPWTDHFKRPICGLAAMLR
jgi:hypothetical protein